MKEGVIFVEKTFWGKLASDRDRYILSEKLIRSRSDIYTNYNKEEVYCDTILLSICDATGGKLYWNKNIDDYIESEDIVSLASVYLTGMDSMLCDGRSIQRGIIVFNNSLFSDDSKVFFTPEPVAIDEDETYPDGWKNDRFLQILANNYSNAIIINDKYLCDKGYVNPNLKNLLDVILPQTIKIPFHLSIFSIVNKNGEGIFEDIKKIVSSIRSSEFCEKTKFYLCYSTIHDRFIISNNYCITSGAGFALFNKKNKPENSTELEIVFPTAVGGRNQYNLWIKKINKVSLNNKNSWGTRENRLFDLVN